ncbi:MAG TPA: pitrilysin family protein [Pyrinomonadaceae bacterium]|jgi:zinc protease|nr:pitrilysin family protein [Pyrinomonadaceae bacterium]
MKQRKPVALLAVIAALLISSFATDSIAQVSMPRLNFQQQTLPNGMRILSAVDHSSPTVAIQVWYHVGSKDDPVGRSGFAHLFEHIMFKATKNMKSEMMDRLTEDVGGFNNAFTNPDVTVYYEVVPSNYLETLLWAEADRLSGLTVDEPNFKSERSVVQEEYRQSYLAPPYGMLEYLIEQQSFTTHPYKRPTIGSIEDLDAASLENVRAFHETFYRPDNATVVVVGDFDPKQLDGWVAKYLAPIPKPAIPLPRVDTKEPARTAERRITHYAANVPLPAIALTYLTPSQKSPDAEPLQVAATILSQGESSRLYRSLIYDQQVAQSADATPDLREDASVFYFNVVLASGKKPEDVERALLAEIKKMQDAPVSAAELEKARNQLVTDELRLRETSNGKALALGEAAVLLGDPNRVNTDLAKLQAVTAADVLRVMKKYFTANNRLVIYYLPEAAKAPTTSSTTVHLKERGRQGGQGQ